MKLYISPIMELKNVTGRRYSAVEPAVQYILACVSVVLVSFCCHLLMGSAGYQAVSLVLLFTVAILSLNLSVGPVLIAASLSALIWNYFFIPPHFTFAISQPYDVLMFIAYFVIAAVTGILNTRVRSKEKISSSLYALTKELVAATSQDDVAIVAVRNIGERFNADVLIYLSTVEGEINTVPHPSSTVTADPKEYSVASWSYWNEKKAGRFIDILPFARCTYYPVSGPRFPLAVIGIAPKNNAPIGPDKEVLLQNFIKQIASTLEREQLNELAKRTIVFAESEKLYRTLFNSISHELRTPVAAIMSATESLSQHHQKEFVDEIHTGAERLNRLVENLLDMTRLETGQLALKLDWCDVHDLFRSSLQRLKLELAGHIVITNIPDSMPLVKLDFGLMEQALSNILYNASLYTPAGSTITMSAAMAEQNCLFTITDNGPGFPEETVRHIFEKFYRVPGSKAGGTGLGLSIVRGFVEAHRGTVKVSNRGGGGAEFIITIPTITHPSVE